VAIRSRADLEQLPDDALVTPTEVARLFLVDPKTVTRWAQAGKLPYFRTLGGHRRYFVADIKAMLEAGRSR
jgi:excisionase family DNA binding protein